MSEETRDKIRVTLMGHTVSEETRRKISETHKSKGYKPIQRFDRTGMSHRPETIAKMKAAKKDKKKKWATLSCAYCGRDFWVTPCRKDIAKFCDNSCKNLSMAKPDRYKRKKKRISQAIYEQNRRGRKTGGQVSVQEWVELKQSYGSKCLSCDRREDEVKLTMDHVIPLSQGGEHKITNIQPLCLPCNCRKGPRVIDYRNLTQ